MHNADIVLRTFLSTRKEEEQEGLLNELIEVYVAPIVQQTIWLRLGFRVSQSGVNLHNADAEDLYQEALLRLVQRLRELQSQPHKNAIRDFSHYVRRVTLNACNDYLRGKAPARRRLKDRLRDTLHRHQDFSLWKDHEQRLLCGFAVWQTTQLTSLSFQRGEEISERLENIKADLFPDENLSQVPLTRICAEIFNWVKRPLDLDQLVKLVADLIGHEDQPEESLNNDNVNLIAAQPEQSLRLEGRERLERFWQEVQRLPSHYRAVICLSFVGEGGENLLTALVATELALFPELATALELSLEELMQLWQQLPMDNAAIAAYLNTTKAQINKWRYRALQRLKKRILDLKEK